ncbi:Spy/CpxP family protein refolding chaperone [Castellaniella sp.]|uniref:Spy/CpxP family protein refolding chaperone n=1 Tax=Castellaniella sp. TaxID=1955812 RepID=UPI002AFF507C|nr:periplasmic heavy metal sensor [Castellaniella sp.]
MTIKPTRALSVLALAAAFAAAPLAASAAPSSTSDGQRYHQSADHHSGQKHMHQHGDRGQRGDRWLRGLDLSQAQKDQIFQIRHDQEKAVYDQKQALNAAATTLRELSRTQPFDQAKAKQAAEALGQAKGQLALLQAQTMAEVHAVLTPEQQKKLTERQAKKSGEKNSAKS